MRITNSVRSIRKPELQQLANQNPWMSPNIWRLVESEYLGRNNASVLEFGSGISSLWHVKNLLDTSGSYTSVEHKADWFKVVDEELTSWAALPGISVVRDAQNDGQNADVYLKLSNHKTQQNCDVHLILRPSLPDRKSQDGTTEEFKEYLSSVNQSADLVVVDGRARVACIDHVLQHNLVSPGGTLVLHDAGRGIENWLGHTTMTGTADYRPAVEQMRQLGGKLLDGEGLDAWGDRNHRRRAGVNAFYYPQEACLLRMSEDEANASN